MKALLLLLCTIALAGATQHNGVTLLNDLPDAQVGWAGVTTYYQDGDGTIYSSQVDYEVPSGGSVEIDPEALQAQAGGDSVIGIQMQFNGAYIELLPPYDTFFELPMSKLPQLVDPATGVGVYSFESFKAAVQSLLNPPSAPDDITQGIDTAAGYWSTIMTIGISVLLVLFFLTKGKKIGKR